jgi:hypothetical protein
MYYSGERASRRENKSPSVTLRFCLNGVMFAGRRGDAESLVRELRLFYIPARSACGVYSFSDDGLEILGAMARPVLAFLLLGGYIRRGLIMPFE